MKKTKEQGITLIALAITVIVLLILAGIAMSSIISKDGILQQAQSTEELHRIKEYEEDLTLKLLDSQMEKINTPETTILGNMKTKINESNEYEIITEAEDYLTVKTKTEGYVYKVTVDEVKYLGKEDEIDSQGGGSGEGTGGTWTHTADRVHVTNGTITLEVGSAVSGYSANGVSNWYVLGAENGRLLITTNSNVTTVTLSRKDGYTGGIATLNSTAANYTNTSYAEGTARTINVNDINRVTGYNPDVAKYNSGTSNVIQWDNEVTYTKNSDGYIYYKGTKCPTSNTSSSYTAFTYWTGTGWKTLGSGESATLKCTYYYYYPQTLSTTSSSTTSINGSSKAYSLLFANTSGSADKCYWLGSQYVYTYEGVVYFGLSFVCEGFVSGYGLYFSHR